MTLLNHETGSIAPLVIGLSAILLAATCTFINVGSLLLFQQRQTQQAEAIALAVAGELSDRDISEATSEGTVLRQLARRFAAEANILGEFEVTTQDGQTVEAKVCAGFVAPIVVPFIETGGVREVCGTAKARRL